MSYARSDRTTLLNGLGALEHIVGKAQAAGLANDVLSLRLTDDMFSLELQLRVALNQVLLALNQVAGKSFLLEDTEFSSFDDVREKIVATRAKLVSVPLTDWANADAPVDLTLPNGTRFLMSSEEDIRDWIMPNLYFHVTMAYALLRLAGLKLGKMDFLPHMSRHVVPAKL